MSAAARRLPDRSVAWLFALLTALVLGASAPVVLSGGGGQALGEGGGPAGSQAQGCNRGPLVGGAIGGIAAGTGLLKRCGRFGDEAVEGIGAAGRVAGESAGLSDEAVEGAAQGVRFGDEIGAEAPRAGTKVEDVLDATEAGEAAVEIASESTSEGEEEEAANHRQAAE